MNLHFFINFAASITKKYSIMKSILITLLLFITTNINAQMFWQRPVVNYNRHEYNAGNQNWKVEQHPNGWMYFANNKGLLEFDGVYWNLYPTPHQAKMHSLKIGNDNKIYVGGLKEFGYFTPNRLGGLDYTSLSATLSKQMVSNIWNVHLLNNKVYYQGDRYFYCYEHGKVTPIDGDGISQSGIVNHRLYYNNYRGLLWLNGNKPVVVPGSQQFSTQDLAALLNYQKQMLLVTTENGLYLYDGKQFSKPFAMIDHWLAGHRVSCASIASNMLAIGTTDDGVYLINLTNNSIERINLANGLQNKSLLSLAFDQDQNLWLGLDNGIDYVPINTQLFFLNSKLSSIGAGYCSQNYGGKLYLGTNQGVYATSIPSSVNTPVEFSPQMSLTGLVHCMYQYDGKLFCGGKEFFAMIDAMVTHKFVQRGVWHVQAISPDLMLIGSYWGLQVMRKVNGTWQLGNQIEGMKLSAKTMFVEPESGNVWVANKSEGLWRIGLDTQF